LLLNEIGLNSYSKHVRSLLRKLKDETDFVPLLFRFD
jgi:hypothetical protein